MGKQQLADFAGPEAAAFLLQRDRPLVAGEGGRVYATQNVVDLVEGGAQFSWDQLVQQHITGDATGEDVGSTVQVVDDSTGKGAKAFVQVLEGRERGNGTMVLQEQDAEGNVDLATNIISFDGLLNTALQIEPGHGGQVQIGAKIHADYTIVDTNPVDHMALVFGPQEMFLGIVGSGDTAAIVAGSTHTGHVTVLAHA